MPKFSILVDLSCCIGCKACALSCKQTQTVPSGISWLHVEDEIILSQNRLHRYTFPMACLHCSDPSCAKVCPAGAISKAIDETVQRDPNKCVGCKFCISACPFGQSHYDPTSQKAEKCNLCSERQAQGETPACTVNCPTGARMAIEPAKLKGEAEKRLANLKKLGYDFEFFTGENVGGTQIAYLIPNGVHLATQPGNKQRSAVIGVWQDVVKPIAKIGLGGAAAAVVLSGITNARKKGE